MSQRHDLVTAIIAGCYAPWTMSIMEDGPEEGESDDSYAAAQFQATVGLIEHDRVVLYGCWGDADDHRRDGPTTAVVFPEGAKVLSTYRSV